MTDDELRTLLARLRDATGQERDRLRTELRVELGSRIAAGSGWVQIGSRKAAKPGGNRKKPGGSR